jgi:hypothetical protein
VGEARTARGEVKWVGREDRHRRTKKRKRTHQPGAFSQAEFAVDKCRDDNGASALPGRNDARGNVQTTPGSGDIWKEPTANSTRTNSTRRNRQLGPDDGVVHDQSKAGTIRSFHASI